MQYLASTPGMIISMIFLIISTIGFFSSGISAFFSIADDAPEEFEKATFFGILSFIIAAVSSLTLSLGIILNIISYIKHS